jgi:hypothetical protein
MNPQKVANILNPEGISFSAFFLPESPVDVKPIIITAACISRRDEVMDRRGKKYVCQTERGGDGDSPSPPGGITAGGL